MSEHSIVVVVSPLVSLMVDQVTSLRLRGVSAAIMSGHKGVDKVLLATVRDVGAGKFSLLFCAPEDIIGERVVAVATDEAHGV